MSNQTADHIKQTNATAQRYNKKLHKIRQTIQLSWKFILKIVFFFAFIALVLTFIIPKKWEASATLQIAKTPSSIGDLSAVEDQLQTIERLTAVGFKTQILQKLQMPTTKGQDKRSDIFLDTFSAHPINNTELISISVSAYSKQDAIQSIQTTINEIKTAHDAMTLSTRNRLTQELETVNEKLSNTGQVISKLNHQLARAGGSKAKSGLSPRKVVGNFLNTKTSTQKVLQLQQAQLNDRLFLIDELSTKSITAIHSSDDPIFPKRSVFLILGALFGLFVGIGITLWKEKIS